MEKKKPIKRELNKKEEVKPEIKEELEKPSLTTRVPISEKDIAMDFAERAFKKFDRLIKATVLFGSQAKNTATPGSDIDVILIIDDAAINWDLELISWYREELAKLISLVPHGDRLHINTVKLTTWWEDLLHGDPVVINILRWGEVLIDSGGFFNPLKVLLLEGRIRSTPEAVYAALQRAPSHLARSKASEMGSIEGVYWCMVDSAQAALITAGKVPPSPELIPQMLKETFVDNNMLKSASIKAMRDIYNLHKAILHGEIMHIRGSEIEQWQSFAESFMLEMSHLVDTLLDNEKKQ